MRSIRYLWHGEKGDLTGKYLSGTTHAWFGSTSCSEDVNVAQKLLDKKTPRTLFSILCYDEKSISHDSCNPNDNEVVIKQGTYFYVKLHSNPAENCFIVDCELISPMPEVLLPVSISTSETNHLATVTEQPILYLIWLDPNKKNSSENKKIREQLSKLFGNDFQAFDKPDECQTFIENKKDDRIILIVGGQVGQQILPKIHDLIQLVSVFIYCMDKVAAKKWTNKYEKVSDLMNSESDSTSALSHS